VGRDMEIVVPNGVFGARQPEAPKKGRPRLHTEGRHKVTEAQILHVEGLREAIQAAGNDTERIQALVDSIHTEPHIYRISGKSDGEDWDFRIGPVVLPFATRAITFSVDIERRDRDDLPSSRQCEPVRVDKSTDPPRRVIEGSLVVTTAYKPEEIENGWNEPFVMMWPPNLRKCVKAVSESGMPSCGLSKIFWRASNHSLIRQTTASCSSISDIEHDAYKLTPELRGSLFLGARELLLGPKFFEMCRYFASKDLIVMTPSFFKVFCSELPIRSEAIMLSFIRSEKSGRRFVNGSSLVRFLDEKVTKTEIIEYIKPWFADMDCWTALNEKVAKAKARATLAKEDATKAAQASPDPRGKKRVISQSTDSVVSKQSATIISSAASTPHHQKPALKKKGAVEAAAAAAAMVPDQQAHQKKKAVSIIRQQHRQAPTFAVDSSSKLVMANWFDALRGVYYCIIGNSLERGEFYVKRRFTKEELQFVQYLSDKFIIKVYSGFNPRGASMIERHWTERDCGQREEVIREDCPYYVHPFLELYSTMRSICNTINGLSASYDIGLQNYSRMKVKNALFDADIPTYTYAEEYDRLQLNYSAIIKNKTEVPQETVITMHARIKHVSIRERNQLEAHEKDFITHHSWPPGQSEVLSQELLIRDPVPAENKKFWDNLILLARNNPREYPYARQSFSWRLEKWWDSMLKKEDEVALEADLKESVKELVEAHCKLSITIFDMPESNVGERRKRGNVPDAFRAAARAISDMSFGPSDIPSFSITTRESLLFNRRMVFADQNRKLISLHEVEKWTVQDLQEVLSACFFDWGGTGSMGPPSQTHVLWIFADRSAIDLGALSALLEMSRITESEMDAIPEASFVDLRRYCVQESETAGLAARIHLGDIHIASEEGSYVAANEALFVTEYDEDGEVDVCMTNAEGLAAAHSVERVNMTKISMTDLPNLRSGLYKPDIAKVNCLGLDSWRQIYTLMCYVKRALVLVGPMETLKVLLKASQDEFFVDDSPVIKHHPSACDVVPDPQSGSTKRLLYKPAAALDLFTSFGNYVEPDPPHVMTWSVPDQVSI
jgi:hypothetical protein